MGVFHTFTFAENEGPLRMEFDFSDGLDAYTRLDDYHLHAHFKLDVDDPDPVFDANSTDGTFVVTDAKRKLAQITIPLSEMADNFAGCGVWYADILLIERVVEPAVGDRINFGRFALAIGAGVTRDVP
jgi:hypothetical protein